MRCIISDLLTIHQSRNDRERVGEQENGHLGNSFRTPGKEV